MNIIRKAGQYSQIFREYGNPFSQMAGFAGAAAAHGIDGLIDGVIHGNPEDKKKLPALLLLPPALVFMGIDIAYDAATHPGVAARKIYNLYQLSRKHNSPSPAKGYDVHYSVDAIARHLCPAGGDLVRLFSLNSEISDDFSDFDPDHPYGNTFALTPDEVQEHFLREHIPLAFERAQRHHELCEKDYDCPVYQFFGVKDPMATYEDRLSLLMSREAQLPDD